MKRALLFVPLLIFVTLSIFLFKGLYLNPSALESVLVGKPLPEFELPQLANEQRLITQQDFAGEPYLINVWATWCPSCKYEHPFLNKLSAAGEIPIFGINYRDERELALRYLQQSGDPYTFSVFDQQGTLAFDMGVYGAPETFVVDHNGIVRKRFAGVLEPKVWEQEFMPLIEQIRLEASHQGASS
ncbi:MAG: DsbE family thiol:disulfide interchange protein [Ferrimonas sp.]